MFGKGSRIQFLLMEHPLAGVIELMNVQPGCKPVHMIEINLCCLFLAQPPGAQKGVVLRPKLAGLHRKYAHTHLARAETAFFVNQLPSARDGLLGESLQRQFEIPAPWILVSPHQ